MIETGWKATGWMMELMRTKNVVWILYLIGFILFSGIVFAENSVSMNIVTSPYIKIINQTGFDRNFRYSFNKQGDDWRVEICHTDFAKISKTAEYDLSKYPVKGIENTKKQVEKQKIDGKLGETKQPVNGITSISKEVNLKDNECQTETLLLNVGDVVKLGYNSTYVILTEDNVTFEIYPEYAPCSYLYCEAEIYLRNDGDDVVTMNSSDLFAEVPATEFCIEFMYNHSLGDNESFHRKTCTTEGVELNISPDEQIDMTLKAIMPSENKQFKYNVSIIYNEIEYKIDPYFTTTNDTFSNGTFTRTYINESGFVQLNLSHSNGTYTSELFDSGGQDGIYNSINFSILEDDNFDIFMYAVDKDATVWNSFNGSRWEVVNSDFNGGDGDDADDLFWDGTYLYIIVNSEIWRSADLGGTWTQTTSDYNTSNGANALYLTGNSTHLYLATDGEDVYVSTDFGVTWGELANNMNGGSGNVFGIEMLRNGSLVIIDGASDVYRSNDGGVTWNLVKNDYNAGESNNVQAISFCNGTISGSVYYEVIFTYEGDQDVWFSIDDGTSWQKGEVDYNGAEGQDPKYADCRIGELRDFIIEGDQDVWLKDFWGVTFNYSKVKDDFNGGNGNVGGLTTVRRNEINRTFQYRYYNNSDASDDSGWQSATEEEFINLGITARFYQYRINFNGGQLGMRKSAHFENVSIDYDTGTLSCDYYYYTLCTTPTDCEDVGRYWYSDQCNTEPRATAGGSSPPPEDEVIIVEVPSFAIENFITNAIEWIFGKTFTADKKDKSIEVALDTGTSEMTVYGWKNYSIMRKIYVRNTGKSTVGVALQCQDGFCDYITFDRNPVYLESKRINTAVFPIMINIPDGVMQKEDYEFTLVVYDPQNRNFGVTIDGKIHINWFMAWLSKKVNVHKLLNEGIDFQGYMIPYYLLILASGLIYFMLATIFSYIAKPQGFWKKFNWELLRLGGTVLIMALIVIII